MRHQKTPVIPRRGVSPDVGIPIDIPEIWRGLPRQSADWLAMTRNFAAKCADSYRTINYNLQEREKGKSA